MQLANSLLHGRFGRLLHITDNFTLNGSQKEAWHKSIEIIQEGQARPRTVALFPEDRMGAVADADIVRIRLSQLSLPTPAVGRLLAGGPALGTGRFLRPMSPDSSTNQTIFASTGS